MFRAAAQGSSAVWLGSAAEQRVDGRAAEGRRASRIIHAGWRAAQVNHAVHYADTMAFHVTAGGNRFSGCYIDGGRAVFEGKGLSKNVWEHGFECCQRGFPAPGTPAPRAEERGGGGVG